MHTIKQMFRVMLMAVTVAAAALALTLMMLGRANDRVAAVNKTRYDSYLLADELRQSSDDLTRLARTYVVSGDPHWEKQYFEILDIRSGKQPRPNGYEKIYWDFRATGSDPGRGTGATIALQELMKGAGFTEEEFSKLKEAQANSDDLVNTETVAMNLVKGQLADGKGGFTLKGEPDLVKARAMMHDQNYHLFKAKIMKPVDQFLVLVDARTRLAVEQATSDKNFWYATLLAVALGNAMIALWSLMAIKGWLMNRLGAEPSALVAATEAVRAGDLTQSIAVRPGDDSSVLATVKAMRDQLVQVVSNVRSGSEGVATASAQIASGNNDLSARTEQQASAL